MEEKELPDGATEYEGGVEDTEEISSESRSLYDVKNRDLFNILHEAVATGKTKLLQTVAQELVLVDDSWMSTLEEYLASVEKIVRNPKTFIIDNHELVPVERCRRTDSKTVRYLSCHSEDVRRIDEDGFVLPIRLLSKAMEEELATYENRVVYTLIQRVKKFIEERYQSIAKLIAQYETTNIELNSDFSFGKSLVSYKLNMEIRQKKVKEETGEATLTRLKALRKRIIILGNTRFCKAMKNSKPVLPPLQRTNMLMGNVDYNNVYKLWLYISSYQEVGYSVTSSLKNLPFDDDYYGDLTRIIAESLKVMVQNNIIRKEQYKGIKFRNKKTRNFVSEQKSALDMSRNEQYNKLVLDGDGINQFYYEKMKALVKDISEKSTAKDVKDIEKINSNFRRFYKGLSKINNALVYDVMQMGAEQKYKSKPEETVLQKRKNELKRCKEVEKKYKLLVELKEAELESLKKKELAIKQKTHRLELDVGSREYKEKQRRIAKTSKTVDNPEDFLPKPKTGRKKTVILNPPDKVIHEEEKTPETDTDHC
jgi:hypothetical protein